MYVLGKPWTPDQLPLDPNRYYTEADTIAMAQYIRELEDKRILDMLLNDI